MFELVLEIMKTLKKSVYLNSAVHYLIIALYIVLSHVQHLVDSIPYIYLRVGPGADLSTLFKIAELLARNPLHAGVISDSALYRALDRLHGMYILDNAEFKGLCLKIFSVGWNKKNGPVIVSDRRDPRKFLRYQVFGTKLTGGTRGISDPALRRRFIVIRMTPPDESSRPDKIFLPAHRNSLKKIAAGLRELRKDKNFKEHFQKSYLNLGESEGVNNRHCDLFDSLFALAKMLDDDSEKKIFHNLTLQFAKDQIYEREEDDSFTNLPTIVLLSVWRYIEPLLKIKGYAEDKFFWAENMYRRAKKDLEYYLGKRPLEFNNVKDLGKILDDHGMLLGPVKRRNRRVRPAEDLAERCKPATHYHVHIDELMKFAEETSKQNEESLKEYEKSLDRYKESLKQSEESLEQNEDADVHNPADRGDL